MPDQPTPGKRDARRRLAATASAGAAVAALLYGSAPTSTYASTLAVAPTPTIARGWCGKAPVNGVAKAWCRSNWKSSAPSPVNFYLENRLPAARLNNWWVGVKAAGNNYNSPTGGPQTVSSVEQAGANQAWVTFYEAANGSTNIGTDKGRTHNCRSNPTFCDVDGIPMIVGFSKIYLNTEILDGANSPEFFDTVAGHELGHAMGLDHPGAGTNESIMYPPVWPATFRQSRTVQDVDVGGTGCGTYGNGLRCVYRSNGR